MTPIENNKTIQESQVILLRKYRWVLLKNQDNINYSDKKYSQLLECTQIYILLKTSFSLDPGFNIIRDERKYVDSIIYHFSSEDEVMQELLKMIEEFRLSEVTFPRLFSQ